LHGIVLVRCSSRDVSLTLRISKYFMHGEFKFQIGV
jgi:hypothetical protein